MARPPGIVRPPDRELWVSHLDAAAHTALRERWPAWVFPMRTGTALWHGDKSTFQLGANVLDVRAVLAARPPATARADRGTAHW